MKYFMVQGEQEDKIMKVEDDLIPSFKNEYAGKILHEGDSIAELLVKFSDHRDALTNHPVCEN